MNPSTHAASSEFITKNHKRLWQIAGLAGTFSWIVLAFFLLRLVFQFLTLQNTCNFELELPPGSIRLFEMDTYIALHNFFELVGTLFQGIVFTLVLRGISLALHMVLETDLNYREQAQEAQA